MNMLKNEIIGEFAGMEIDETLSVPTLCALEAIFYLRLQLAQVGREEDAPVYEDLCCERFGRISKALIKKYRIAGRIDEKIEILNHLENISSILNLGDGGFVAEKRQELRECTDPGFSRKYRLEYLRRFNYDSVKADMDRLLAVARNSYDIAMLFSIDSLGTDSQYAAVMDLYAVMFNKAAAGGNIPELSNLLVAAAYCNSDPDRRRRIKELTDMLRIANPSIAGELAMPVLRVNAVAAEIYSRMDRITGKYDILSA